MAATINFDNLVNGQVIELPYGVTCTITSNNPDIESVARQIDDNPVVDAEASCDPQPNTNQPITLTFDVTTLDCPLADTFYLLSIYVWDQDAPVSLATVTIKTAGAILCPRTQLGV